MQNHKGGKLLTFWHNVALGDKVKKKQILGELLKFLISESIFFSLTARVVI